MLTSLPTTFDSLFRKYGGRIPVPLLRALAKRESDLNPKSGGGSYWGLLQVGYKNVLPSYNERRGTNYSPDDLFDPEINVKIAADLLNRITVAMDKHPSPNMKWDPSNPESVKLLLAGWNSGYSEAAGLGKVASYLEAHGIPVTHENVFKYARTAGATKYLQREEYDQKRRWQAGVASLYFSQPDTATKHSTGNILVATLLLAIGYALYVSH
jgi:soluble lytic murein transglycosylase-like protein